MKKILLLLILIIVGVLTFIIVTPDITHAEPLEQKGKFYYTDSDLYWLSRVIHAEAKGESERGKFLVGYVVMNRVRSDGFPDTIKEVIFQKNQFSCVDNGAIYDKPTDECVDIAMKVLENPYVLDKSVLYFYNPQWTSRGNWIRRKPVVIEEGNHVFCKE